MIDDEELKMPLLLQEQPPEALDQDTIHSKNILPMREKKTETENDDDGCISSFLSSCYLFLVEPLLIVNHERTTRSSTSTYTVDDSVNTIDTEGSNQQTNLKSYLHHDTSSFDHITASITHPNAMSKKTMVHHHNQQPTKSKNINLILLYTFIISCSKSIWNQSVLSSFIYLLQTNDPQYVGFTTANMGLAEVLSSIPAGYLADKYRRDTMIRISSIVGIVAASWIAIAVSMEKFWILAIALALWGIFWGINLTSISAMFADSIPPDEDRNRLSSYYFTQLTILQLVGSTVGPMVAYVMFDTLGDVWKRGECAVVIQVGQVLSLPAFILLYLIRDDHRVNRFGDDMEQKVDVRETKSVLTRFDTINARNHIENDKHDIETAMTAMTRNCERTTINESGEEDKTPLILHYEGQSTKSKNPKVCFILGTRTVPTLVATADVINGLATGMSLGYFPIYLLSTLKLRPDEVQIITIFTILSIACLTHITQWVSTKIGRLQTTIVLKYAGITILYAMNRAFRQQRSYDVVCGLFVLKSALLNAPKALTRSVVMDHVPTSERAKWSSLESINMLSLAGSAALGGFLVDERGLLYNFSVSAWCQFIATFPLILALAVDTTRTCIRNEIDPLRSENEHDKCDD